MEKNDTKCEACSGNGAIIVFNDETNRPEIQRCDQCNQAQDMQEWLRLVPISTKETREAFQREVTAIIEKHWPSIEVEP